MAQVIFIDGIASISGKLDGIIYRRTASGKTIAYKAPQQTYRKPTPAKINHRNRFALISKLVSSILRNPAQRAAFEQLLKLTPADKPLTVRKFIFQQLFATLPPTNAASTQTKS